MYVFSVTVTWISLPYIDPLEPVGKQSLQQCKHDHDDDNLDQIRWGGEFDSGFAITKTSNVVMDQILKQVDENVDAKGNYNETKARSRGNVHIHIQ